MMFSYGIEHKSFEKEKRGKTGEIVYNCANKIIRPSGYNKKSEGVPGNKPSGAVVGERPPKSGGSRVGVEEPSEGKPLSTGRVEKTKTYVVEKVAHFGVPLSRTDKKQGQKAGCR